MTFQEFLLRQRRRSAQRQELTHWFGKMITCVEKLTPAERAAFEKWDYERPAGVRTSDWPLFEKYIGKRPSGPSQADVSNSATPPRRAKSVSP